MSLTSLVFVAAFVVGSVLALVRHPIYGLLVYIASLYFDPAGHWWGSGALSAIRWEFVAAAVTLAAMFIHRGRLPRSPLYRSGAFWGFVSYVVWIAIQSGWALDTASHQQLLTTWLKFLVVMVLICGCVDSWRNFRLVLWAQVIGCAYLGWLAFSTYTGGRFQGFADNALGEANYAALELVIGLIIAASLFLAGQWRTKAVLLAPAALIADAIVTTVSRSGFLAAAVSLVAFNLFTPKRMRARVGLLSLLAVALFLSLTTANYWSRIQTIKYEGADVAGVDTGGGRLDIVKGQLQMFELHPFGCGAMCTNILSPQFIPSQYLVGGQRSSHNTFMSMLVNHGVPGGILYLLLLVWIYRTLRRAARYSAASSGDTEGERFAAVILPALAAVMVAIVVGDLFVEYPKLEARVWFVALLISYVHLRELDSVREEAISGAEIEAPAAAVLLDAAGHRLQHLAGTRHPAS